LSLDLKAQGIAVGLVHPGFMRTEMTKSVGFDKYWDAGGGKLFIEAVYEYC
jgi:short-subunit dehydrogenase